jgi:hypothetical protein
VRSHEALGVLMVARLGASGAVVLTTEPEVVRLIEAIQTRSAAVAASAGYMRDELIALVEALERSRRREKSLLEKILHWLGGLFKAAAGALAAAFAGSFPVAATVLGAGAALAAAAASVHADLNGEQRDTFMIYNNCLTI